jgi:hypothetical protein
VGAADSTFKRMLPVMRLFTYGSRKPPGRIQYMRLLHRQDTALLRLFREFGACSAPELEGLAKERRWRFRGLTTATVADWLKTAARRDLVAPVDSGEPSRWSITDRGRVQARGLRRHFESGSRLLAAFVKWLVPLLLGGAALGLLIKVDWKDLLKSDAPLVALAVVGYLAFIVAYSVLMQFLISIQSLTLIEFSREAGEVLTIEVEPASALPSRSSQPAPVRG